MSNYKPKLNWGIYYTNDLFYSDAYQTLTNSSRNLLHCLMSEVDFIKIKHNKRGGYLYPNNGSISLTQSQFTSYFGCTKSTYKSARDQLIEVGCIKITHSGGMGCGDIATYTVLTLKHVPRDEQRWREYPSKNWLNEIPRTKKQLIGISTQWKPGECGRKTKPTLTNHTLNEENLPNKLYPSPNQVPNKLDS